MNVSEIIADLAAHGGRNDKIAILKKHSGNEFLKKVLIYALNPMLSYNIRIIPAHSPKQTPYCDRDILRSFELLDRLANRTVTGHAAIHELTDLLNSVSESVADIVVKIIDRDLRCGVAEATVNKVFGKIIPVWPCFLATDQSKVPDKKFPYICQTKFDGTRSNVICKLTSGGPLSVSVFGRSGKPQEFNGVLEGKISDQLSGLAVMDCDYVLDGELVVLDSAGNIMPRKKGNGIINKAIAGTISDAEAERVRFKVWDIIPYDRFVAGQYDTPYEQRLALLSVIKGDTVTVVSSETVMNESEASEMFLSALADGLEGIMLKAPHVHWANERSQHVLKYKAENELDLLVIDVNPGKGKFEGMTGSLVCVTGDRKLSVNVSGFPDELRSLFTSEYIVGKIVSVKYNEIIDSDSGEVKSLFLPRFVEVRLDKDVPDNLPI